MKVKKVINFLKKRYGDELRIKRCDPFQLLITTVLSQRTKDENTEKAANQLFAVAKTPEDILKLPLKRLESLIKPSGMYRQKARRIKQICKTILKDYEGKVPKTREDLLKLPGVGYKTADIVLSYGFGIETIAVDTHVNRISKRLGLVEEKADVETVRKTLEKMIRGKDRFVVNLGLVKFGQEICKPIRPRCEECELKSICKYFKTKVKPKTLS